MINNNIKPRTIIQVFNQEVEFNNSNNKTSEKVSYKTK